MPRRLLQFAISQLGIIDTDVLDLENLDIAWGKNSVFEFKNVGLRLEKLENILQLPSFLNFSKANITLLRLTIPVDIYSSSLKVEIEGLQSELQVKTEERLGHKKSDIQKQNPRVEDPGKSVVETDACEKGLPNPKNLARSFLDTEPQDKKTELEAAIFSEPDDSGIWSALSYDGDDCTGVATSLALPTFMFRFLQGITDRLQVKIHNVEIILKTDTSNGDPKLSFFSENADSISLRLKIEEIDVKAVGEYSDSVDTKGEASIKESKKKDRLVHISQIQGYLEFESNLLSSLACSSTTSQSFHVDIDARDSLGQIINEIISLDSDKIEDLLKKSKYSPSDNFGEKQLNPSASPKTSRNLEIDPNNDYESVNPGNQFTPKNVCHESFLHSIGYSDKEISPDIPLTYSPTLKAASSLHSSPKNLLHCYPKFPEISAPSTSQLGKPFHKKSRSSTSSSLPTLKHSEFGASHLHDSSLESNFNDESHHTGYLVDVNIDASNDKPNDCLMKGKSPKDVFSKLNSSEEPEISKCSAYEEGSMYMSALSHKNSPDQNSAKSEETTDESIHTSTFQFKSPTPMEINIEGTPTLESGCKKYPNPKNRERIREAQKILSHPELFQNDNFSTCSISTEDSKIRASRADLKISVTDSIERNITSRCSRKILSLDNIRIYLPGIDSESTIFETAVGSTESRNSCNFDRIESSFTEIPGSFSTNKLNLNAYLRESIEIPESSSQSNFNCIKNSDGFRISIGVMRIELDTSVGKLILKLASLFADILKAQSSNNIHVLKSELIETIIKLNIEKISINLLDRLKETVTPSNLASCLVPSSGDILLKMDLIGLQIFTKITKASKNTSFSLDKFTFGYKDESILSFDSNYSMKSSVKDLKTSDGVDISAQFIQTIDTTRFEVTTLPINISINLQKLDDTFSWLGGLSSVLNLGSSIASSATAIASSPSKPRNRGVRFETPTRTEDIIVPVQNKSNIRIGGCKLDLIGSECNLMLRTSAIKIVCRDEGIGISVHKLNLSGPHLYQISNTPAITVEITNIRIEILPSPKDRDFDRLLSLITPSKSKYDQDDDILLETLLHQRGKGAVLRLTIDEFKGHVTKIEEISYFPELLEEVSKLATVAKYLPEDDSSGFLFLALIHNFELVAESGHAFGNLRLLLVNLEVALITLPALFAIGIESLSLDRNSTEKIIESVSNQELQELSIKGPVIMARIIGNEMEPIIKIKLWNLNFEYHLPTFISLIEFLENLKSSDNSNNHSTLMAASLGLGQGQKSKAYSPKNSSRKSSVNPLTIHFVFRNCTLGLNPLKLPSKLLLTLTETHLNLVFSKNDDIGVSLELKKISFLIINNVSNLASTKWALKNRKHFDDRSSQVTRLCSMGYVSIGYLSSAKVVFQMKTIDGEREVKIEVCDDLFVLESCADSTQTLIAVLGGLMPTPALPDKETKYRTEVVPMQDLFASLSVDAFGTAEGDYNFDDDFGVLEDIETCSPIDLEDNEDFDFDPQYYEKNDEIDYDETNSSSLIARETQDGILLESYLEPNELADDTELEFQENHFGASLGSEGDTNKWNSAKNTYERSEVSKLHKVPISICIRDFHVTWNLFDGYDWQSTRDTISKAVKDVTFKAIERRALNERKIISQNFDDDEDDEDESVIEDFLFNSIYIGVPANRDPRDLTSAINQDLNDTDTDSTATTNLSYQYTRSSSSKNKHIKNLHLKNLHLNRSKHHKITFDFRGICIDFIAFPPGTGETQSSLDIQIHDFEIFDHIQTSTWKKFATYMQDAGQRETDSSMIHIKILNVKPVEDLAASEIVLKATLLPLRLHVDQDALDFLTRFFEFKDDSASAQPSRGEEPFIQRLEVDSIKVKLDFKPKRVDYAGIRSGHTTEFMNFLILDGADIELRHTIIYGISGFEKLGKCLNEIWMPDVKRNQLPGILAGIAPVRPLVNVGSGFRHLVIVPIREYKKDGRIIRSISKGAAVFAKTTSTELVKLGAKVAVGVQTVLQGAEDFLTPSGDSNTLDESSSASRESKKLSLYANQPFGVLQGLKGGYNGLQRDLLLARDAIIAVSGEVMESGTAVGAFKAVGKHAPTVILRPAIGVVKASGQILMGATNSLDPVNLQRAEAKYKK